MNFERVEDLVYRVGMKLREQKDADLIEPAETTMPVLVKSGYEPLFLALTGALEQAQSGKGSDRHAQHKPFLMQPIMQIPAGMHGHQGFGFQVGQACKKASEATGMIERGQLEAASKEILGAINYLAAAVIRINQLGNKA